MTWLSDPRYAHDKNAQNQQKMSYSENRLYGLEDQPPVASAMYAGFQHLLAIFGGILTAPLLIALGMGLGTAETTYVISAALIVSGIATLLQIRQMGILGTGLLSIQGTSFAFIGPLVYAYQTLVVSMPADEALGLVFGSTAVCAVLTMILALFVRNLRTIITSNVAGATIILLGISLIIATLQNIQRAFDGAGGMAGDGLIQLGLAALVFVVIFVTSNLRHPWLKLSSITLGLAAGVAVSAALGMIDRQTLTTAEALFLPQVGRYPLAVDWYVVALVMPIFLVSAMESIGDITATNALSGLDGEGDAYWRRIRGGIMVGGLASLLAALISTFPSTTFSQNNGVIRLTGVCSRIVGYYVAVFLVLLGCVPIVAALFQAIPGVVVYGATLLMFGLVAVSGYRVVQLSGPQTRDWIVVTLAIVLGYLVALNAEYATLLSDEVIMVLQFPVSTGGLLAILIDLVIPKQAGDAGTSD